MSAWTDLLEIEDRHDLWGPEALGFRLWPIIRYQVLKNAQDRIEMKDSFRGFKTYGRFEIFKPKYLKQHIEVAKLLYMPTQAAHYDALFFTFPSWRYPVKGESCSFDTLYGGCFDFFKAPLILENSHIHFDTLPDCHYSDNVFSGDSIELFVKRLHKRFTNAKLPPIIENLCLDYASSVATLFDLVDKRGLFAMTLKNGLLDYLSWRYILTRLLSPKVTTPLAFVSQATYLAAHSIKTYILHDLGFKVIELQHGGNVDQPPYQYSPKCMMDAAHPCHRYLPDLFLSFGQYWQDLMRLPCRQAVVGKYQLNAYLGQLKPVIPVKDQILIVSQPQITDVVANIAIALATKYPTRPIKFKLHPRESLPISLREQFSRYPKLQVLAHEEIYPLIAESSVIIGFFSTVLFEALAFPEKRIFAVENDVIPGTVACKFSSTEQLLALLDDATSGIPELKSSYVWAPNWDENFGHALELVDGRG